MTKLPTFFAVACGLMSGMGAAGFLQGGGARFPASADADRGYAELPCADRDSYEQWASSLNFRGSLSGDICDPASQRGRFSRVLALLRQMKTPLPPDWKGGAAEALRDPLGYVASMASSTQLDLTQVTSIAYNRGGDIFIGGAFFTDGPADSASTLVHESRHSSSNDPRHAQCRQGDIPWSAGGCDERFRVDGEAGAYAYEASLGYGVAAYNPSVPKPLKELLLANSLFTVSHRFNVVPETLAVRLDRVVVLDEEGGLFILNAVDGHLDPLAIAPGGVRFERIRRGKRNDLLYGFSRDMAYASASGVDEREPMKEYFAARDFPVVPVRDLSVMAYDAESGKTAALYYVTTSNVVYASQMDPATGKVFFEKSSCQVSGTDLMALSLACGLRYFLSRDGQVFVCLTTEEKTTVDRSGFVDPAGFRQIEGGLFFANLYGVSRSGKLEFWDSENQAVKYSRFTAPAPMRKYLEASGFRAALLEGNALAIRSWDEKVNLVHKLDHPRKIVDFAILSTPGPMRSFIHLVFPKIGKRGLVAYVAPASRFLRSGAEIPWPWGRTGSSWRPVSRDVPP